MLEDRSNVRINPRISTKAKIIDLLGNLISKVNIEGAPT